MTATDHTETATDVAFRARAITHRFDGLRALDGVDLEVRTGETRAIIGPNGAGKTTLFNILSGAFPPTSGRIELFGEDVTGLPPHQLHERGLGRSFQITSLFPDLTVRENLAIASMANHSTHVGPLRIPPWWRALDQEVDGLVDELELADIATTEAGTLSHGDQRRLDLALTLASNPRVVLLDEPTAGMARRDAHRTIELLERIMERHTIVLVEHDMQLVMQIARHITVLHQGRAIAEGTPDEIRANDEVQRAYLAGTVG
jgi:branched-chain amino acid transport system ATP-binding protein